MTQAHRWLLKWARTLHVYLTLFGFVLLLFFALTGFMLNHEDWFSSPEPTRQTIEGKIPTTLLGESTNQLGVVEKLRKDFGARGEVDIFEDEKENDAIRVNFKAPGYFAEAIIKREDGATEVKHESRGFSASSSICIAARTAAWRGASRSMGSASSSSSSPSPD